MLVHSFPLSSPLHNLTIIFNLLVLRLYSLFCIISHDSGIPQLRDRSTAVVTFICLQTIQVQNCLFHLKPALSLEAGTGHGLVLFPVKVSHPD